MHECGNGELPHARPSPRLEHGALVWYEGDTFEITIDIDLKDQEGEPVTIRPEDTVSAEFFDARGRAVKRFDFTGVTDNAVTLAFDGETTALFPVGEYTYDIYFDADKRKTLAKDNRAVVE